MRTALRSDYRHVDTATMYGNEAEVGAARQDSGLIHWPPGGTDASAALWAPHAIFGDREAIHARAATGRRLPLSPRPGELR